MVGDTLVSVGIGFTTSKAVDRVCVPPPGATFVTVTSRNPSAASRATERSTNNWLGLLTVSEVTVTPDPKLTVVTPGAKPEPVTSNPTVFPRAPEVADRSLKVGEGLLTVKPPASVAVPPPGEAFVIVTSRGPPVAFEETETTTLSCVELLNVVEFTVIPVPRHSVVCP